MRERTTSDGMKSPARYVIVTEGEEGQRIDNYLFNKLKNLPKTRVYRILRKGEVRVNKKRIPPAYRVALGDSIRIPPLFLDENAKMAPPSRDTCERIEERIIYEDDFIMVLNKPSGMAVHAGSTVRVGIIEALKYHFPHYPQLELVHRLDTETSGCLVLAKKKRILRELHELLREGAMRKVYWALTKGSWQEQDCRVEARLQKEYRDGGKHVVMVNNEGKSALTVFKPLMLFKNSSLMEVHLYTGRTHQIRVHAAYKGHPIAGDDRYGDSEFNKTLRQKSCLQRLFLHAKSIEFVLPSTGETIKVVAPLDEDLQKVIDAEQGRANAAVVSRDSAKSSE